MMSFKVTDTTQKILRNLAGISNSIQLKSGALQRTNTASKAVLVNAQLDWPNDTAIFDLSSFLGALTLFQSPEIDFKDDAMVVTGAASNSRIRYRYSDASTIPPVPTATLPVSDPDLQVTLTADMMAQLRKVASLLKKADTGFIVVSFADGAAVVKLIDSKNALAHSWEYSVPAEHLKCLSDVTEYSIQFKVSHISLLLEGSYTLSMKTTWQYGYFESAALPVSYYVVQQR